MDKNKYERRSTRSYQKIADHYDETFDGRCTLDFKNLLLKLPKSPMAASARRRLRKWTAA